MDFPVLGGPSRSDLDFEQGIQRFREGSRDPENHEFSLNFVIFMKFLHFHEFS